MLFLLASGRQQSMQRGQGISPQFSALISWEAVVGAQLFSNGSEAQVEGQGKQHAQHNGAGDTKPEGDLAGKGQACG